MEQCKPRIIISASRSWQKLDLEELWRFRDLLITLAARDVKVRYKQTVLGATWVIVQPLLAAGIFSFVFGNVAKIEAPGGVPYFLFAFVGLMAWNVFSGTLGRASVSLVGNAQLVSKVYFPRMILPLSTISTTLVDFGVTMLLLVVLMATAWHFTFIPLLLMPLCILLLLMLALGIGFVCTAFSVKYRDVRYILPVATQLLMWASPVAYAAEKVPTDYQLLYYLNPLVSVLEAFKFSILGTGEVSWPWLAYSTVFAGVLFIGGTIAFKHMEGEFADVI